MKYLITSDRDGIYIETADKTTRTKKALPPETALRIRKMAKAKRVGAAQMALSVLLSVPMSVIPFFLPQK